MHGFSFLRRHDKKRSFVSNYCGASHKLVAKLFCLLAFYIMPLFFILSVYKKLYTVWFMTALFLIYKEDCIYNPQIQISAESETKRSIFREKDKTKRSKKESAQHSKSRNKSFVMTSVSAL